MDSTAPQTTLPLSVVVATTQPWPEVRGCLEALLPQIRVAGAELILADGSEGGLPADFPDRGDLLWLRSPGSSPHELRALGLATARGTVVAMTEDHCHVHPTWCRDLLAAHARHPDVAAIGGSVANGAADRWIDWASFFVANGPFLRPLPDGHSEWIAGQANVSYKRSALPESFATGGIVEAQFHDQLRAQGQRTITCSEIEVDHVQSLGFWGTCAINYHNGRTLSGLRELRGIDRVRALAWAAAWPLRIFGRTLRIVARIAVHKRRPTQAVACMPLISLLLAFHGCGEIVGLVAGPGESPRRLR